MSEAMTLGLACFAAAFIGAAAGAALVWRALVRRIDGASNADPAIQEMLHRMPALLQQTLKIESDFYAQRQSERDGAQSSRLERWQAEQEQSAARREERSAAELRDVLLALSRRPEASVEVAVVQQAPTRPEPTTSPEPQPHPLPQPQPREPAAFVQPVSARPPELLQTPLPRAVPVYSAPEPQRELTDEEIDALPADVPASDKPRKRILPSPKKSVLRNL
jgi:hypothetical protein